jgi:excisionase family DNA binding protein
VSPASLRPTVPVNGEQLLSLKEAATQFPLSERQLRHLARRGRLAATKVGRDWVTTAAAVTAYLADAELRSRDPHKYKRG